MSWRNFRTLLISKRQIKQGTEKKLTRRTAFCYSRIYTWGWGTHRRREWQRRHRSFPRWPRWLPATGWPRAAPSPCRLWWISLQFVQCLRKWIEIERIELERLRDESSSTRRRSMASSSSGPSKRDAKERISFRASTLRL